MKLWSGIGTGLRTAGVLRKWLHIWHSSQALANKQGYRIKCLCILMLI